MINAASASTTPPITPPITKAAGGTAAHPSASADGSRYDAWLAERSSAEVVAIGLLLALGVSQVNSIVAPLSLSFVASAMLLAGALRSILAIRSSTSTRKLEVGLVFVVFSIPLVGGDVAILATVGCFLVVGITLFKTITKIGWLGFGALWGGLSQRRPVSMPT